MKHIIISLLLILSCLYATQTYAQDDTSTVQVILSEKVPGIECDEWKPRDLGNNNGTQTYYTCDIPKWTSSLTQMFGKIIKYFTFIAWLWGVLFIVINGIMYSMWGIDDSMKEDSKKRIFSTLAWLALLMLSWVFLNMVAPWVYK